jgi:VanZ family protein
VSKDSEAFAFRRPSHQARALLVAVLALVVYASLSPWTGWRHNGVHPLAYLTSPLPRYITGFDLLVNVLGYLPLGALFVLSMYPRVRGVAAFALGTAACVLLAGSIEALQTYLPARIASSLDLATNGLGAALGAAFAARYAAALIDRGRLMQLRARWFRRDASIPLVLVALWPLAQLHPGEMLFGNGEIRDWIDPLLAALDVSPPIDADKFGPADFVLAEAGATTAGLLAAGLTLASNMLGGTPRARLLLALLVGTLLLKTLAFGFEFGAENSLGWATAGAIGGLMLGLFALLAGAAGRPRTVARMALLATVVLILVVNLTPENPYHPQLLEQWQPGSLLHAARAAHWLATAWPYVLLLWLIPAAVARLPTRSPPTLS